MVSRRRHPYLDHVGPIAFAHRGGTSAAPENTLRAFEHAIQLGYRYIETDVHATKDGVLVAFHDDDLTRTCGDSKKIAESTWAELQPMRVNGTDPIPLLEDILGSWPDVRVNIDCKSEAALVPLVETIQRRGVLDRVCIGSFSDSRLQRIRQALGDTVCTSMGPREIAQLLSSSTLRTPFRPHQTIHAAQIPVKQSGIPIATRRTIDAAHRAGLDIHIWTIDDPLEMSRLLDLGVDGIMTDDTRALKDVMTARGLW